MVNLYLKVLMVNIIQPSLLPGPAQENQTWVLRLRPETPNTFHRREKYQDSGQNRNPTSCTSDQIQVAGPHQGYPTPSLACINAGYCWPRQQSHNVLLPTLTVATGQTGHAAIHLNNSLGVALCT